VVLTSPSSITSLENLSHQIFLHRLLRCDQSLVEMDGGDDTDVDPDYCNDNDNNDSKDDDAYVDHHEEEESDVDDDQSDDTISKLNDEDVVYREDHIDDEYEDVIQRIQLEEERLMTDLHRNLPPDRVKKGRCDLNIDQRCLRFFKDPANLSNFQIYLGQRRESKQAIEGVMIHASQFASYSKLKVPALKTITTAKELLETISQKHPMLCHQHFDFLQQIHNLRASTIVARIDSVTLLYEWMRLNSNDIHIFRDVSLFPCSDLLYAPP
jgi:hypothetical protein